MVVKISPSFIKKSSLSVVSLLLAWLLVACGQDVSPTGSSNVSITATPGSATTSVATPTASAATSNTTTAAVNSTLASTPGLTPASTVLTKITPITASSSRSALPTSTPLASDSLRSYLDANYQFGIVYPSDWKLDRSPGRVRFTSPTSATYGVSVDAVPQTGQAAKDALKEYVANFVQNNSEAAVSNPFVGNGAGGVDTAGAFIIFPDPTNPQLKIKAYIEKVYNEGVMYTLIASSEADKYAARQTLFDICLNSFLPLELVKAGKSQTDTLPFSDFGVKLNYPKSWAVDKKDISAGTVLTIANPQSTDVYLTMQILTGTDPAKFNGETFAEIQKGATDYQSVEYKVVSLSPTQTLSRWIVLFVSGKGLPIYRYIYTFADAKTGLLYSLQASAFSTHYLAASDALMAILQSFSIS